MDPIKSFIQLKIGTYKALKDNSGDKVVTRVFTMKGCVPLHWSKGLTDYSVANSTKCSWSGLQTNLDFDPHNNALHSSTK